ncbi:hypothetical protein [Plantactinospora sp. GCM10030261]|uniref:hypothetical protein n=1 Tax=Plantactinospora sp. GCM10030261 TaxID=3273420 RepID=UPI0036065249
MTGVVGEHVPNRPEWVCRACGLDWPCPVARSRLTGEYRCEPVSVGMYLCAQMHDAIADLAPRRAPLVTPAGFHARFLGWVRADGLP